MVMLGVRILLQVPEGELGPGRAGACERRLWGGNQNGCALCHVCVMKAFV